MPVITPTRALERRRAIIDAAAKVFVEKGYASASISQIAAVAGVSDGLIYRYFDDKRALLDIVLSEYFAKIVAKLERAAASEAPFAEKVRSLISQHLRSFLEDLDFCRFFVSDVRSANNYRDSPVKKLNRAYTRIFIKVLAEGIAGGEMKADLDPRLVRDVVFGAVEHVAWRQALRGKSLDIEDVTRQITEVTLSGVAFAQDSPKRGARFSQKAATPSRKSAVSARATKPAASASS
jgi:TetR/AcrR family transcriptional regulator, fatty acid metabolism regulator protein